VITAPPEIRGPFEVHTLPSGQTVAYRDSDHSYWPDCERTGKVLVACAGGCGWTGSRKPAQAKSFGKPCPRCEDEIEVTGDEWKAAGDRLAGASTIAKVLDPGTDALMVWAWRIGKSGRNLHEVRDEAAERGTNVHERIFAALGRGEQVPSLAELAAHERPFGQGAFGFWRENRPKPLAVEQAVYHPMHGYAGRFDLLADLTAGPYAGRRALVDAKTKERKKDGSFFDALGNHVQIAGYRAAAQINGFPRADVGLILYLLDDGSYELVEAQAGAGDFLAALKAFQATKALRDQIAGKTAEPEAVAA
jgi:hypothetical protein